MAELRILIADDHELIRRGLRDLLGTQSGWQVVGEACNGLEAVEMAVRLKPNIAILDFFMPQLNGPVAAAQILEKVPAVGVVVLTMDDSEQVIREVLQAGVRGLVLKSDADRDLLEAVQSVAENRHFFGARVAKRVLGGYLSGGQEPEMNVKKTATRLTGREREVMRLLAEGMTSREAAVQLNISIRTVESHRTNISRKLNLSSIADLVRYAIRNGIVAQA
jgi:DNA-binding NarL/FixJ family response regulator